MSKDKIVVPEGFFLAVKSGMFSINPGQLMTEVPMKMCEKGIEWILRELTHCKTVDDVRALFVVPEPELTNNVDGGSTYRKVFVRNKEWESAKAGAVFFWEDVDRFLVSAQSCVGFSVAGYKIEAPCFLKSHEEIGPEKSAVFILTKGPLGL